MNKTKIKVTGEAAFGVNSSSFGISASASGYTLQWSVDNIHWDDLDDVDADTNWPVSNAPTWAAYRLKGNTSHVVITY